MKIIKIIIQLLFIITVTADRVRVWSRIPQYYVYDRTRGFMNENGITNCYEYLEESNYLRLKCWRDNQLMEVDIRINPSNKKNYYIGQSLSISI
jgi:hypothetical protein